jgi:lipopolysaccharide/colanic/teichoic acid biosynthesis glycosyltransferase
VESWERPLDQTKNWPVTRLASWSLTLLLAGGLCAAAGVGGTRGLQWLTVAPFVLLTTVGSRALFEVVDFAETRAEPRRVTSGVSPALLTGIAMLLACAAVRHGFSPLVGILAFVASALTFLAARTLRRVEIQYRRSLSRVYFVGSSDRLSELRRELFFYEDRELVGWNVTRGALELPPLAKDVRARGASVVVLDRDAAVVPGLRDRLSRVLDHVGVRELGSYYEEEFKKIPLDELNWFAVPGRQRSYTAVRRLLETTAAAALFVVASPLLLLAIAAIRLDSRGPAIYRQRRVGKNGVPFTLVKLRTMTHEVGGVAAWASAEANRVTPVGRYLRRFHIDELPQLWNVIWGDLALIGPRPEQVPIVEELTRRVPQYAARACVRPGMTGWAQVSLGYGGSLDGALAKLQRDLWYVKNASVRLDALIVWLTIRAVLAGRG